MCRTKASTFPNNKKIKRQDIGGRCADLRSRFLELQLLRRQVRIAQCGTVAPSLDEPPHIALSTDKQLRQVRYARVEELN
jgi:hypothetical protein